jgi:hypothetical protein
MASVESVQRQDAAGRREGQTICLGLLALLSGANSKKNWQTRQNRGIWGL